MYQLSLPFTSMVTENRNKTRTPVLENHQDEGWFKYKGHVLTNKLQSNYVSRGIGSKHTPSCSKINMVLEKMLDLSKLNVKHQDFVFLIVLQHHLGK